MISILSYVIHESVADTSDYFNFKQVKLFLNLSKKMVLKGTKSLTPTEQTTYRGLFDDPVVKDYIIAAQRTGIRDGWIRGGVIGGVIGATATTIAAIVDGSFSTVGVVAIALLNAVIGGFFTGWTYSKILPWFRKWKAEDDIIELGRVGGQLGKTVPMLSPGK